jgi:hypothetical protein
VSCWARFVAVSALLLGATTVSGTQGFFAEDSKTKTDLREAIFRYMFERYTYGSYVKVFCIHSDVLLPENFLSKFADHTPRVVWASDCETNGAMNSIRHKKTSEPGMRMTLMFVRLTGPREAEAQVEAFSDGIAANWNTLKIVQDNGKWKVKCDTLDSVS